MSQSTINLSIEGMKCGGCVDSVCKGLVALPGVTKVDIDLDVEKSPSGTGRVEFDPNRITPEGIIAAVGKLGFSAGKAD
ncbi:MAG: heavy-metal-associated domain-containing protein [Phycisphaeraceae bacterium]|nr:heavy-metal-associated domain-containing protein [Phycisphaeraceae bacterium]